MDIEELSCSVSLRPTIKRQILFVVLLLLVSEPVQGQFQVIGSLKPIMAVPGDDVILPCHVEPQRNVEALTVEWSKADPKDRPSWATYVHVYRNNHEVPDMKSPLYAGRTSLFADGLRHGNISLKIINITLADGGTYKCYIPKLGGRLPSAVVHLVVSPDSANTGTTETTLEPRDPQTPDPTDETAVKGGLSRRNRLVSVVAASVPLILCVGVALYLAQTRKKKELIRLPTILLPCSKAH